MRILVIFGIIVGLLWAVYSLATFTVDETQRAVVLRFGKIERVVDNPGLNFKLPFVQNVVFVEDRLLSIDIKPADSLTFEKQQLTIDSYTLWRIINPELYVETQQGLRSRAEQTLDDIVFSNLKDVVGGKTFEEVLQRDFLTEVRDLSQSQVSEYGIEIVDVRIKRADLPEENENAVYERMISERTQIAERFRAEGQEQALDITSSANADVVVIKAEGEKQAEVLRGEGDAAALEIYANAYNQDTGFFLFWRTLESYKKTLTTNSTLVLSSNSEYLRLLETMRAQALLESINR